MNLYEISILDGIQNIFRCNILDKIFPIITATCDAGIIWIVLALILVCIKKTRKVGLLLIFSLIIDVILCNGVLKPLINRIRPFVVNPDAPLIATRPKDASFPSGHTAVCFACAFGLMFEKIKYWIPAMIFAVLIAFTRLYLYFHYPTDVLGGVIVGLIAGFIGCKLCNYFYNKYMIK